VGVVVEIDMKGEVFYIDALRSLPDTWKKDYKPAGGLPAIETKDNDNAIKQFLKDNASNTVGPVEHNVNLSSDAKGKTTVNSQAPK
jgi:hypothetical protein